MLIIIHFAKFLVDRFKNITWATPNSYLALIFKRSSRNFGEKTGVSLYAPLCDMVTAATQILSKSSYSLHAAN